MSAHNNLSQQLFMHPSDIAKNYRVNDQEMMDPETGEQLDAHEGEFWDRKYHEAATRSKDNAHVPARVKYKSRNTLAGNIEKHGVTEPVELDPETKEIVDGHHRLAVARGSNRFVPVTFKKQ
jgi:hypothetical protein